MNRKSVHHSATEAPHGHDLPHVTPMKYYWGVLGALLFLTVVTVGVSELGLPMPFSIIIAMLVASVKATLVVTVFMHLLWDKRLNAVVLIVSVAWMLIFFSLVMVDMLSRGMVLEEQGHFYKFDETMDKGELPAGWRVADPNHVDTHGGGHGDEASPGDEAKKEDGGH